jgi:signal transduction histidine kinase
MKLAAFIQGNLEIILQEWEAFAKTQLPAAASMGTTALRDHAKQILLAIAADMQTHQSGGEQKEKSLGHEVKAVGAPDTAATTHGELRHDVGFDLVQLVAEYRALRASVLRLWIRQGLPPEAGQFDEMLRFNEAIDQAIAESVSSYSSEIAKARDTFTAILGHDLRSPLGAIVMSAHNAASYDLPETAMHSLAVIQRCAKAMQVMIRDLLDFAGARLGREMPMRAEESSLVETCHAALAELMAAHPKRTFAFEHDGDVRGHFDPTRIGQVLSNLLNNAIIHGEPGRPVTVRARGDAEELVVDVINTGKPISSDALQAIMDPVSRLRLPGSEGSSGLGLGLYIAQQVAKAHGGSVTAASYDNETRFSLRLPRATDNRSTFA